MHPKSLRLALFCLSLVLALGIFAPKLGCGAEAIAAEAPLTPNALQSSADAAAHSSQAKAKVAVRSRRG